METLSKALSDQSFVFKKSAFSPYNILIFLYFSTTCAELLNIKFIIFRLKLNFVVALFVFLYCLYVGRVVVLERYLRAFLVLLGCMFVSLFNSANIVASVGFLFFFVFTYSVYTIIPMTLQQYDFQSTMSIYSWSFIVLGSFSIAQVLFSVVGIDLPFVMQKIGNTLARGQAWTYEPSFFALYMTPFISYENARYFLLNEGKSFRVFLYNIMFLSTTSTGCFFTYIWFIFILGIFLRKNDPKKWKKLLFKCCGLFFSVLAIFSLVLPKGFFMLFKFFVGEYGTSSFWCRWNGLVRCWNIFLEHPLVGVGMGGVSSYSSQKYFGVHIDPLDPMILDIYPGMNVTTEILASLGLLGVLGFIYLFYLIFKDFRATMRIPFLSREEKINVQAFAISLCVTAFTYQFSQSIMRSYIWVHIAICIGYLHLLQETYSAKQDGSVST